MCYCVGMITTHDFLTKMLRKGYLVRQSADPRSDIEAQNRSREDQSTLIAGAAELLGLGYLVSPASVLGIDAAEWRSIIAAAEKVKGADRQYATLFRDFPRGVRDESLLSLVWQQILGYYGLNVAADDPRTSKTDVRSAIDNGTELQVIVGQDAALRRCIDLVNNKVAVSPSDKELIDFAIRELGMTKRVENAILNAPNRENQQIAIAAALSDAEPKTAASIMGRLSHPDSILRATLALYAEKNNGAVDDEQYNRAVWHLSNVDANAIRMKPIPRVVRSRIACALNNATDGFRADNLVVKKSLWRKVLNAIHYFDYVKKGRVDSRPADIVYENIEYTTYNSMVEAALRNRDVMGAVEILSQRPGALLRRVVQLAEMSNDQTLGTLTDVIAERGSTAGVSTLVSAYNGVLLSGTDFKRITSAAGRDNHLRDGKHLDDKTVKALTEAIRGALVGALKNTTAPKGAVGVNSDNPVALIRRDQSDSDVAMDRGARFKVFDPNDESGVLRLFMHWYNTDSRVDIDISTNLLDGDGKVMSVTTWNTPAQWQDITTYSGDITNAPRPRGASEFIDVDVAKALKAGVVWAGLGAYIYYGAKGFDHVDNHGGAMMVSHMGADSGALYQPDKLVNAFSTRATTTRTAVIAVNLITGEGVWLDATDGESGVVGSAADGGFQDTFQYALIVPRMSYGDLARAYAEAHGADTTDDPADVDMLNDLL